MAAQPLSGQYEDFWMVTESALAFACRSLNLACSPQTREELMESYLHLKIFSDARPALTKEEPVARSVVMNAGLSGYSGTYH